MIAGRARALEERPDAGVLVAFFAALLLLLPQRFAFSGVSDVFTPVTALGLLCGWIWITLRLLPASGIDRRTRAVRAAIFVFLWAAGCSWVASNLRVISEAEQRQALAGLVILAAAAGPALLAADAIHSLRGLEGILGWLVLLAAVAAVVSLFQFGTGSDPFRFIQLPGLAITGDSATYIGDRSLFRRVGGTSAHPIELSVILAMMLPVGLHFLRRATSARWRWAWAACLLPIAVAIPISLSRSGLLCVAVGAILLLPTWPWRQQLAAVALTVAAALGIRLAVPGLVGTLLSLFEAVGADPSISHRTGDYAAVAPYVTDAPWFGRGFHTFIPSTYDFLVTGYPFLDNQYLSSLVEMGVVGVACLLGLLASGALAAWGARRLTADPTRRSLFHAIAVAIVVAAVGFAFFDALSFQQIRDLSFLLVGVGGAAWRLQAGEVRAPAPTPAAVARLPQALATGGAGRW